LTPTDLTALYAAASEMDWRAIDPTIFGTLFERGLDPGGHGEPWYSYLRTLAWSSSGGLVFTDVVVLVLAGAGIGLANVAMRLQLLYGQEGSIRLYSRPGKGTLVRLSIPMKGVPRWPES